MRETKFYNNVKQLSVYNYISQIVDIRENQDYNVSNNKWFFILVKGE
jgi:hypothetical protein